MVGYDEVIIVDTTITKNKKQIGKISRLVLNSNFNIKTQQTIPHRVDFFSAYNLIKKIFPEKTPKKIVIYLVAIEKPEIFSEKLTPKIEETIPKIVEAIVKEIKTLIF